MSSVYIYTNRCVLFGTGCIWRFYQRNASCLDLLSGLINLISPGGKQQTYVYSLRSVMEICRLLMVVQFCPSIKSRAIANYRQSDRSWNRIRANLEHFILCCKGVALTGSLLTAENSDLLKTVFTV